MRLRHHATLTCAFFALLAAGWTFGQDAREREDRFRQLQELLPTPSDYRAASGAPGHRYWQQRADYVIDVSIDEKARQLTGRERVTYHNHSPDALAYLWVQLDANIFAPHSHAVQTQQAPDLNAPSFNSLERLLGRREFDGSCKLAGVRGADGRELAHKVVDTMLRLDLAQPLAPGASTSFEIDWSYAINDAKAIGGRTGYEFFEDDGNCIFELAQWFPRMCAYTDVNGWQHKQFLGQGEFTLEFGDYLVRIDVPADHIVASTGVLQNPADVLSAAQRERLAQAEGAEKPVMIVTLDEAAENEKQGSDERRTWVFKAENVRDFAFASSRKYLWDAVRYQLSGKPVWCMSFYPKEAEPLWSKYSTHAIVHTLDIYSRHTFDYPYPVAQSVNGPVGGMEYPMISFNGPRPEKDGTYSSGTKYGLISVIIHEVGHNYFPMIVNSDERDWSWMDEGLNTFCQFLAEQEWETKYPSGRGEPRNITGYMKGANQVPIMTQSDSVVNFGPNAYSKPATALNVLRETVMGRELFDFAFKSYAQRWMFKRPQPADFFRSMEDASAVDLDWFWRGWFYSTDHVDMALRNVKLFTLSTLDPRVENERKRRERDEKPQTLTQLRNAELEKRVEIYPELADFYNSYDALTPTAADIERYEKLVEKLTDKEKALLAANLHFYVLEFENVGGLPSPLPVRVDYEDGSNEEFSVPAEIWRQSPDKVTKLWIATRPAERFVLDPRGQIADCDESNNAWPPKIGETRVAPSKQERGGERSNPMQQKAAEEAKARKATETGTEKGADRGAEGGPATPPKPAAERGASADLKPPEGGGSNGG
jgi:hypothetical protein